MAGPSLLTSACSSRKVSEKIEPVRETEAQRGKLTPGQMELEPSPGFQDSSHHCLAPLPLQQAHHPLKTHRQRAGFQKSRDCLKLVPVSMHVANSFARPTGKSKAFFIPQSSSLTGDNPGVIPSETSWKKNPPCAGHLYSSSGHCSVASSS